LGESLGPQETISTSTEIETHPIPFEAILRTKVAFLHPQLEARGTLKAAGIVVAVVPHAFSCRRCLRSHGEKVSLSQSLTQIFKKWLLYWLHSSGPWTILRKGWRRQRFVRRGKSSEEEVCQPRGL